eukprot:TCONS_00063029-protein
MIPVNVTMNVLVVKKASGICYNIQNLHDPKIEEFVGSKCIKTFEEELQEVLKVALRLVEHGLNGTYKGIANNLAGKRKMRFQIDGNNVLVKHKDKFKRFLNFVPVYQAGRNWETVLPPFGNSIESQDYAKKKLRQDMQYKIKLGMRQWRMKGKTEKTGFSLYITSIMEEILKIPKMNFSELI